MRKNQILISFLVFFVIFKTASAQDDLDARFIRKTTQIEIQVQNGNLSVSELYESNKIFYRNFEKHNREAIFFSDLDPIVSLEAHTVLPEKSKTIKVSTIETKDMVTSGIFYGGYKRKDFAYPSLVPGAFGNLRYTKKLQDPCLISPFYFGEPSIEVDLAEYIVVAPPEVLIEHKILGINDSEVKFSKENLGDRIRYSWKARNIKPYQKDKDAPAHAYSEQHLLIYIKSYKVRGTEKKVLSDPSDLYQWYLEKIKLMPPNDEAPLKKEVETIVAGKSDKEKIQAIFQWVQDNISYVAFEDGMAGFVPRNASDVYTKRYGDCKDMANLLKEMLQMAGFNAHRALIGTRSKPYSYSDVPCPVSSNHMICVLPTDNQFIFLDATDSFSAFGMPSSMIQGKEALMEINDSRFEIIKVPEVSKSANQRFDSVNVKLNGQNVIGQLATTLTGYKKEDLEISRLKDQVDKREDHLEDFLKIGGNNISLEKITMKGLDSKNYPAKIYLNFKLPGYSRNIGEKIYINLNLASSLPGEIVGKDRTQLIERPYKYEDKLVVTFTLPENYDVSYLPQPETKSWGYFGISTKYTKKDNQIIFQKDFYSDVLYLKTTDFEQWNTMIRSVSEIEKQTITLIKTSN